MKRFRSVLDAVLIGFASITFTIAAVALTVAALNS
jgi:hypothetical protein